MTTLAAKIIIDGACDAPALVTRQPIQLRSQVEHLFLQQLPRDAFIADGPLERRDAILYR